MRKTAMVGLAVIAGAAVLEAAVVPAVLIGGTMLLAPNVLPKSFRRRTRQPSTTPLRRIISSALGPAAQPRKKAAAKVAMNPPDRSVKSLTMKLPRVAITQALVKTVTFRIIATSLDFTANYVVIGEIATAAGLSAVNLVGGPLFYFVHELVWNRPEAAQGSVDVRALLRLPPDANPPLIGRRALTIDRAMAKTITFRTLATTMDFTVNYVVVRDIATAAGLSAFGFIVGPFIYYWHEKAWDTLASPVEAKPQKLSRTPFARLLRARMPRLIAAA